MAKQVIMELSKGTLILNVWVEVKDGIEDKAHHNYQGTFLVDIPLQGGVPMRKENRVPIS